MPRKVEGKKRPAMINQGEAQTSSELLSRLVGLVEQQGTQLKGLLERVTAVEEREIPSAAPQFVPMRKDPPDLKVGTYVPPEDLMAQARKQLRRDGDFTEGRTGLLDNPTNVAKLPPQYRPIFHSGSAVRINPEATVHGSEGKWGEILKKQGVVGVGEVLSIQYITQSFEPKYTVVIPGLTRRDGAGFRESELLPA